MVLFLDISFISENNTRYSSTMWEKLNFDSTWSVASFTQNFRQWSKLQHIQVPGELGFISVVITFVEGQMVAFTPKWKQENEQQEQVVLHHRVLK